LRLKSHNREDKVKNVEEKQLKRAVPELQHDRSTQSIKIKKYEKNYNVIVSINKHTECRTIKISTVKITRGSENKNERYTNNKTPCTTLKLNAVKRQGRSSSNLPDGQGKC
jgi:hypothetical protein